MAECSIPVIDMQDFPGEFERLRAACEEWGCFRIINHGIPVTLMAEMKAVSQSLLDLPVEIKRQVTHAIDGGGYLSPPGDDPVIEALGLYEDDERLNESVHNFCTQLNASPRQRTTISQYTLATLELAMEIGRKLAKSLGLDMELFVGWHSQLRMIKYNFTPATVGTFGADSHSDLAFLTILQDDDIVGGLEVMEKESGEYVAVDPLPGSFLINLGDIATAWSNGRFYNVKHQVQCKEAATRVSIVQFVLGPKEVDVEAPQELVDSERPRRYLPFAYGHYRELRASTGLRSGGVLDLLSV